jgi:NADH-quinone oxidoreductase subunit J
VTSTAEAVGFWLLAPLAVIAALGLLFARKAVHAALGMALVMCILGVFYIMQKADFLGIVQIFVYTGAVMMLFLFVLMLVGVDSSDSIVETLKGHRWASFLLVIGLAGVLFFSIGAATVDEPTVQQGMDKLVSTNAETGNVTGVAELIFGQYVWVFEITSALLITAALGAMVLAHRERIEPKRTQKDLMLERVRRGGAGLAPLPGPGVYADHDAVDTPALLPDGSVAPGSVPDYLQVSGARPRVEGTERELDR